MIIKKLGFAFRRWRGRIRRVRRLVFMSPAEARFVEIMGGRCLTIGWLRSRGTGFPVTLVVSLGSILRAEHYHREVRVGKYFIDFGNDVGRGLEIDGREYHTDVVAAFDRDSYLYQHNWIVKHIPAHKLWNDADSVQREVLEFLYQ